MIQAVFVGFAALEFGRQRAVKAACEFGYAVGYAELFYIFSHQHAFFFFLFFLSVFPYIFIFCLFFGLP